MKKNDLKLLGVPNSCLDLALEFCSRAAKAGLFSRYKPSELIKLIMSDPTKWFNDSVASRFAKGLANDEKMINKGVAPFKIFGEDQIEIGAINQMRSACELPIAMRGAMMPDSHAGYGINIGGVLATVNTVIPYAVGVDIACMMSMSVLDIPENDLSDKQARFEKALTEETVFGAGKFYEKKRQHSVMDRDWKVSPITKQMKDTAWSQLGTSGSGNHYCEFGIVEFIQPFDGIDVGKKYIAIMSHSGSRGVGAKVCQYYNKIAQKSCEKRYSYLAWLGLDTQEGQEYWNAMQLMDNYAKANHDIIHSQIIQHLGCRKVASVSNSHNLAWKEVHDNCEVVVHRKGATPAGIGALGVIPGSMASPAYVVRGLGNAESLNSASHGAGRKMSRSQAKQKMDWGYWNEELIRRGVKLLSAGIDEVPGVYKDIESVMLAQSDLVEIIAKFDPKIVKMADDGIAED